MAAGERVAKCLIPATLLASVCGYAALCVDTALVTAASLASCVKTPRRQHALVFFKKVFTFEHLGNYMRFRTLGLAPMTHDADVTRLMTHGAKR